VEAHSAGPLTAETLQATKGDSSYV